MNEILDPIVPDGRTGFDKYGQLASWSLPDADGTRTGIIIRDVRCMICKICNRGWQLTTESLRDQTRLDEWTVHKDCYAGWRAVNSHFDTRDLLIKAGYLFNMEEVPSQYPHSPPWQQVAIYQNDTDRTLVEDKHIVIGERKRVWEIQAFGFGDLSELFTDVNDTKGYGRSEEEARNFFYIHAWTKAQVEDYLTRIRLTIPLDTGRAGWVHKTLPFIDLTKDQK